MKAVSIACGLVTGVLGLSACQAVERGSFGAFTRSLNDTPYGYQVVEDPTGSAPTPMVERFEVQPGDCGADPGWSDCANDRERSELSQKGDRNPVEATYWYGWSIFFPGDYRNVYPTKVALGQCHQVGSHPVWMFQNAHGGYHLDDQVDGFSRNYHELIDEEDLREKWHRIEVHAKWSGKKDGFFKVWVNGEQKVDYSGRTMTATKTYFKYGIYRSFLRRYKTAKRSKEVPGQIVYYTNVRRADSREGLAVPME